jgi:hypothetical protein
VVSVRALLLSGLFVSSVAFAQAGVRTVTDTDLAPRFAPEQVEPKERSAPMAQSPRWYGWKIMTADAALGVVLAGLGVTTHYNGWDNGAAAALGVVGVGSFALTPAVIHGLNGGSAWRIAGSVSLRLGLPVLGFALGAVVAPPHGDEGIGAGALAGGVLGLGLALGLDWFALSWTVTEAPRATGGGLVSLSLAPTVSREGRWGLALSTRW